MSALVDTFTPAAALPLATRTAASATTTAEGPTFLLALTTCFVNGDFPLVVLLGLPLLDEDEISGIIPSSFPFEDTTALSSRDLSETKRETRNKECGQQRSSQANREGTHIHTDQRVDLMSVRDVKVR